MVMNNAQRIPWSVVIVFLGMMGTILLALFLIALQLR